MIAQRVNLIYFTGLLLNESVNTHLLVSIITTPLPPRAP